MWSQVIVGNIVYAGGKFGNARPAGSAAGTNNTVRNNLLAYDITTGALVTSFVPNLNGQVLSVAASPDGKYLYVGGDFTQANGLTRSRIAGYDLSTGALLPQFAPLAQTTVRSVVATNSSVYFGGDFKTVNGVARGYVAAADRITGALSAWAPAADAPVTAMVMTPDSSKLILGGRFANVNSTPALGLAAVSPSTGALQVWNAGSSVQDYGTQSSITSLSTDGTAIYGTGYVFGSPGNLEGTFSADPTTGNINWIEDCHGDTYGAFPVNGVVYTVSHAHYCGNIGGFPQTSPTWTFHHALAFTTGATGTIGNDPFGYFNWAGNKSPSLINWFPDMTTGTVTGQGQAAWSVTANANYVVLGGEFPSVNGVAQAGLVRFAVKTIAPNAQGPMLAGPKFKSTLIPLSSTTMRVSWPVNWDRDDLNLTYKVVRNGNVASPVFTTTVASPFWAPNMGFIDTGLQPSTSYYYKLYATDAAGHTAVGDPITVVTPAAGTGTSPYAQKVVADGASTYWPMNETAGPNFIDHVGFNDAAAGAGVTWGTSGAISGDTAASFNGSATASATTATAVQAPDVFTATAWFRAAPTMTTGGKILGFGNAQTGTSGSYDRHIYMDNAGHIIFGVYNNSVSTLISSSTYNDGQWHQVAASLGPNGMNLYIDGLKVGSRTDAVNGQNYQGFWRIGGDNLGSWTNQPSNNFFTGDIDEVAIFPTVLTKQTVQAEYVASGRAANLPSAPADTYGSTVFNNNPDLYWRLSDTSGTKAADSSSNINNGTYYGGVTLGVPGLPTLSGNTAVQFNGSDAMVSSNTTFNNPLTYSEEAWFKTTTTTGGKIMGFGNTQNGLSSGYDRHIYMQDNGQLVFGTWTGQTNTITSGSTYNDGQWHHVVATQGSPDGMKLYVDGALVGTNPQTSAQDYTGYWKVGGDYTWGSSSQYFAGTIDEAAVYPTVLTASQVATDYSLGSTGLPPNQPPVAKISAAQTNLDLFADGTGSTDPDGTVSAWAWNFGDGQTGTGSTVSHHYAVAGTYVVSLTVTDNRGGTNTITQSVVAVAPNVLPTAAFTSTPTNLSVAFDGSTSTDSDGTIASYAWTFGDGSTGTGVNPTHVYATGGTFSVALTVTDNRGGTNTITQTVSVLAANVAPIASFTTAVKYLGVTVNGSASSDPDGTVASYAWDFGDGQTASGATPPAHVYAVAGTYPIALTVTDNRGGTNVVTKPVTVAANVAPVAAFTTVVANRVVTFDGTTSTDADGTIASYAWDFGDGTTGTGVKPGAHTFPADGSFTVKLTVTDDQGATNTAQQVIQVAANKPPVAAFTSTVANLAVTFDATGSSDPDGSVASYAWNFGDGQTGTGKTPAHTYLAAGTYPVALTVTDNQGATTTLTQNVVPTAPPNQPPTSSFTYTASNLAVTFNGSASTDPDGTLASYAWDFGDGTTGTGATPSHTYTVDGPYTVKLTVTDNQGATGVSSQSLSVAANQVPIASFTTTLTPLSAAFDASTSTDPDGSVVSYAWTFGDGQTGTGKTPSHTYATAGTYQVKLTVTDNQGATGTVTTAVTVAAAPNQPPTSSFTYTVSNLAVTFNGSASTDPDGTLASYAWDFGDGTTGTGATPSHTYTVDGPYTVKLTVTDNQGATGVSSQSLSVAANQVPIASFTTTLANLAATFNAGASSDPDGSVVSYAWTFGDGQTGTGKTPSHTYATAGTYQVKLTVTDNQGATGTVTTAVTVAAAANQPPVAAFTGTVTNLAVAFDAGASADPDGTIASYAWDYGDSTTGTGKTSSHTYAAAGTYQVKLTVTDNQGLSTSITKPVVATVPAPTVYAADAFNRTLTSQWGTADVGGAWTVGAASLYSVSSGSGKINLNASGVGPLTYLNSVSAANVNYSADVSINVPATGGGVYQTLMARHSGTSEYRVKAIIGSNGAVTLYLTKLVSNVETTLKSVTVTGLTYTAGTVMHLRFLVTGSGTTTLSAKAWLGATEPTAYQVSTTDTTATLQGVGSIGLQSYLSGSATNAPVISTIDNISVVSPN